MATPTVQLAILKNSSLLISVSNSTGVQLSKLDFDGNGAEMGFFFGLSLISVFFLLDQLNGRVFRMKIYLMNRDFQLVNNQHVITALTFFIKLMSWFAISLPFLALAVWAAGLIARAITGGASSSAGITVALVGMSLFFFLLYFFRIKWNNYKFDIISGIYLVMTFLCITAYQFVTVFMAETSFGISAIFLSANGLVMLIIVFIQSAVKDGSVDDLIKSKIPIPDGTRPPRDPQREVDFEEEISKEKDDKEYQPTTDDLNDIFSIGKPKFNSRFESPAYSSGLQNFFGNLNPNIKRLVTVFLWILATGILVVYAIVMRSKFPETKNLGIITLVALLTTDVLVYLIQNAEIIKTATPLAVTLFLNRFFLIVFGSYWVYGYILIYVCYGVLLSTIIAQKRFPLEDEVKNFDLDEIAAKLKAQKDGTANVSQDPVFQNQQAQKALNELGNINQKIDEKISFLKAPEYPFLIITVIYIIIFIVLSIIKPTTIPLPKIRVNSRDLHFFVAWAFLLVLVIAYFTSYAVVRLFIRRKMGTSQKVYFEFQNMCAMKVVRLDRYWVFMVLNMITLVAIGIIAWYLTMQWTACVLIIFIDLYLLCIMNFFSHFIANDYLFLQNIENVNIRVNQHNLRYDLLKKEIENAKKQIMQGGGALGGNQEVIDRAKELVKKADEKKIVVNPQPQPVQPQPKNNGESWDGEEVRKPENKKPQPAPIVQPQPKPQPPAPKPEPAKVQVNVMPKPSNNEEDLVNDEINKMNDEAREKGRKNKQANDGIYEGGEEEENKAPLQERTELLVDPDEEEEVDEKTTKIKYKNVVDWRNETNFFAAFWTAKLRKNDYQIVFSILVSLIVLVVGGWLVCATTKDYVGITIFIPFLHYSLAAYSHMRTLSTDTPMFWFEYVCFFLAYIIQYGWNIFNLYLTYGFWNKNIKVKPPAGLYIVVNLIMIPFITTTVAAILKWIDSKGKITPFFIAQLVMSVLQAGGMLVCAFIYMTWKDGVGIAAFSAVLGYIIFQVIIYMKNDQYLPRIWVIINIVVVICAIIATFVASFFVGELSIFMGFSISAWLSALLLLVFGIFRITYDIRNMKQRPIFFSPWVFPIYIFDPKKQSITPANLPAGSILGALVLLLFWSVLATAWFTPVHAGVALSILFEHILIISIILFVQISHLQLHKLQVYIDKKTIKRAWLESKARYLANRNAFNRDELITYEDLIIRRNQMRNKMRILENRETLSIEEKFEGVEFLQNVSDEDLSWLNTNLVDMTKPISQYSYLFDIEQDITKTYRSELELIIMFQLLVIAYTEIYYDQKKKYLFNFLTERRPYLLAVDIVINIPPNMAPSVQYVKVIQQLQNLPADKFQVFNDLREQFIQEMRVQDDQHRQAAMAEEQKAADRQRQAEDRQRRKKEGLKNNDPNKPVDQWVDCIEKWDRIKREGKKFTDTDFAANGSSLGRNVEARDNQLKWIRASEQVQDQRCVLYKDKVNALDVIQGQLKDCYFLSAISVLGEKNVEAMLKTTEEEWRQLGSFCVRFYRDGQEEYVIVDDYFPAKMDNNRYTWAFCKGGDLGDELWPMVLEKAYAKHYGAYENIEAGKVHYALADMIEGFPQQIDLKKDIKNTEVFWEKLKGLFRQGALMGAGSPENPLGDAAINQAGIVQGHAYSLLNVQEVDSHKLIQLRNPHGKNGAEWRGDWSDSSTNWNQRFKSKLSYEPRDHEDGVFWMDVDDFVEQYSYLYICRLMNEHMGWYKKTLFGQWQGASAEGLPNKKNPSAKLQLNPHYGVTITKPCDGFILLKQKEGDSPSGTSSTFKGKQSIFFMLTKNSGKRVMKVDTDSIVVRSGNPTNLMSVSNDFEFDTSVSYPYTFSLLIANTEHGAAGEGNFEVTVYSTDANMTVSPMAEV